MTLLKKGFVSLYFIIMIAVALLSTAQAQESFLLTTETGKLLVLNPKKQRIEKEIQVGDLTEKLVSVKVSRDGKKAYVASEKNVYIVDLISGEIKKHLDVGYFLGDLGIALSCDEKRLYLTNRVIDSYNQNLEPKYKPEVKILNLIQEEMETPIPVCADLKSVSSILLSPNDRYLVLGYNGVLGRQLLGGSTVINIIELEKKMSKQLSLNFNFSNMTLSPDQKRIYFTGEKPESTNNFDHMRSFFDPELRSGIKTLDLKTTELLDGEQFSVPSPTKLAFNSKRKEFYIISLGAYYNHFKRNIYPKFSTLNSFNPKEKKHTKIFFPSCLEIHDVKITGNGKKILLAGNKSLFFINPLIKKIDGQCHADTLNLDQEILSMTAAISSAKKFASGDYVDVIFNFEW